MSHSDLIKRLGGVSAVASALGTDYDRVYQWTRAEIAWRWRHPVKVLAEEKQVALPAGFLGDAEVRRQAPRPKHRKNGRKQ